MARKHIPKLALVMLLVVSLLLTSVPVFTAAAAGSTDTNATFANTVLSTAADPHVLYDEASGYYYAYSTAGAKSGYRFGIYRSPDLTTWEQLNGAIPSSDPNTWANDWFWAPECYYNENNGYYYLFYSGRMTTNANKLAHFGTTSFEEACKTGVAVSTSPAGPFYNITKAPIDYYPYDPVYHDVNQIMDSVQKLPPATKELGETAPLGVYLPFIDANVFFDDNGEIYLYYSRNAYRNWVWDDDLGKYIEESNIYAVKLTSDWWNTTGAPVMPSVDPAYVNSNKAVGDGETVRKDGFVPVINYGMQKQAWENGHVNDYTTTNGANKDRRWAEGSTTMKFYYTQNGVRKAKYYIVYSCNNHENRWYGEGYATADSPLGPWKKSENNPIVALDDSGPVKMYGTGHGSFISSPDGKEMYHVYHSRPNPTGTRYMYTNKFIFDEETLEYGAPTIRVDQIIGDQPIPSGVAPYTLPLTCNVQETSANKYDVSFNVLAAQSAALNLANTQNRVAVTVSNPAAASYTAKNTSSGTITLLTDDEVTVTFTYQRRKADGSYYDVLNNASNAATAVQRQLTFNSPAYSLSKGETITVPIRVKDCNGFSGMSGVIKYDDQLLALEGISARKGYSLVSGGNSFVAATPGGAGVTGDTIVGYALFRALADVEDDISTIVSFQNITAYNDALQSINPNLPDITINLLAEPPQTGDVNLDGKIDVADAIALMQYLAGSKTLTSRQLKAADANKDGKVNVGDVTIIMQMCL